MTRPEFTLKEREALKQKAMAERDARAQETAEQAAKQAVIDTSRNNVRELLSKIRSLDTVGQIGNVIADSNLATRIRTIFTQTGVSYLPDTTILLTNAMNNGQVAGFHIYETDKAGTMIAPNSSFHRATLRLYHDHLYTDLLKGEIRDLVTIDKNGRSKIFDLGGVIPSEMDRLDLTASLATALLPPKRPVIL